MAVRKMGGKDVTNKMVVDGGRLPPELTADTVPETSVLIRRCEW